MGNNIPMTLLHHVAAHTLGHPEWVLEKDSEGNVKVTGSNLEQAQAARDKAERQGDDQAQSEPETDYGYGYDSDSALPSTDAEFAAWEAEGQAFQKEKEERRRNKAQQKKARREAASKAQAGLKSFASDDAKETTAGSKRYKSRKHEQAERSEMAKGKKRKRASGAGMNEDHVKRQK